MNVTIDASVLIKFYLPEVLGEEAERLLGGVERGEVTLWAPDLIYPESGNVLWKKYRLKELNRSEVGEIVDSIGTLPMTIGVSKSLLPLAVEIGIAYGITVYDAMYMSMASLYEAPLVTGDRKLVDRMAKTDFSKYVVWLGNFES